MNSTPAERFEALLAGTLTPAEKATAQAELADDQSPLAQYVDGLDPDEVEQQLRVSRAGRAPAPPLDAGEAAAVWGRIEEAVGASKATAPVAPSLWQRIRAGFDRRSAGAGWAVGALAAGLLVWVVPRVHEREKGGTTVPELKLQLVFHVAHQEHNRPLVIERGVPGARYGADSDFLLRFQTGERGHACLVHRAPGAKGEALGDFGHELPAGEHELRKNGRVQAVRLAGQPGRHVFYAVWGPTPLSCPEALAEVESGRATSLLVDSFAVEVLP